MLSFLVFGLPRSGTTWAANWLSADRALCFHDAAVYGHPSKLDAIAATEQAPIGIACTLSWMFGDWLAEHSAPVLLLDRPLAEINLSCARAGIEQIPQEVYDRFQTLDGLRIPYKKLFEPRTARRVWNYLLPGIPFSPTRHHLLRLMRVETDFAAWANYHNVPWNKEGIYEGEAQERRADAVRNLVEGNGLPPSCQRLEPREAAGAHRPNPIQGTR